MYTSLITVVCRGVFLIVGQLLCSGVSGYTVALERKKVEADFMTLM